ncbi:Protein with RING/U-box and TRAF-like domain [Arabidopsis thaliana]|uniref:E3 ubiquitin-protein ligase SINA-like 11 n=1 Tax=Arabidopsis thaliana TaxID=3702 RepID=SIL11_ARATH|nr:Protein with RING/U-box and TRAF-like domain [Arabidopsis thaliana]Q9FM14.2 RecName: Full=E3 ubiquitin-protein ligase SINA-like 11; AltName: Full=RING-type E3 ubiquitin transferase SINA-like 11; AltName: Full=Seven in absentia-like protein 11 [Arabidopsis thaliana]ANM69719.1 Protein with RING/U-box and TRAF-like domain [Arabidopsis thaliana]|eukprot:NP_001331378.1 Protein with RING/U-box and TRAF-like domain [Arabidopsis thaliana]
MEDSNSHPQNQTSKRKSSHPQKKQRMENETRSAKLLDLDVLDCPVCFEPLTIPTFQCDDGHIVCNFCFAKVSNKCPGPGCDLPIGNKRCFAMERVLESAFVPCQNTEFGCTKSVSYEKVSSHEKECNYSQCSCPNLECNYTGSYNIIYGHFMRRHLYNSTIVSSKWGYSTVDVLINIKEKVSVLWESRQKLLFVVQCFKERHGVYVTVRRIAPPASEFKKFSYRLSYSIDGHNVTYESPEVKRLLEVNSQIPDDSFMFVPNCLLHGFLIKPANEVQQVTIAQETVMEDPPTSLFKNSVPIREDQIQNAITNSIR